MWSIYLFAICACITVLTNLHVYAAAWTSLFVTSALAHSCGPTRPDLVVYIADRIAIAFVICVGSYHYIKSFRTMSTAHKLIPVFSVVAVGLIHFGSTLKWPRRFIAIHVLTAIGHLPIIMASGQ
jgi:hypothetical protein